MNPKVIPTEIFDLLATKSFTELSKLEKDNVNRFMSSIEYNEQHELLRSFNTADGSMAFTSPGLPTEQKSYFHQILNFRIPFYQVAAGMTLLIVGTWAINNSNNEPFFQNPEHSIKSTPGISVADGYYPDSLVFKL